MENETVPPRQFFLMVEEKTIALMVQLFPALQYVEVRAVENTDFPDHVVLCHPKPQAVV